MPPPARGALEERGTHGVAMRRRGLRFAPPDAFMVGTAFEADGMSLETTRLDPGAAYRALFAAMRERKRVLVAFSGGVDSGVVARVAHDALGDDALAVLADAESLSGRDREEAVAEAGEIGIALRILPMSELLSASYVANPSNRCYFCRKELGRTLGPLARELGFPCIADGVNVSDLGDYRPGIQAMDEEGFWHPLVESGLRKSEVRALARHLGLSFHAKPSNACLSSRIAYGEVITVEKLQRVDEAEQAVRALGFPVVRVRAHADVARIEVPSEDIPRLTSPGVAEKVVQAVRDAGFVYVTVDLRGYRSGSMNEAL